MRTLLVVILGVGFGYTLSRSGAADYNFIQGMFLLENFQLYGIIGTAVVIGMPALWLLKRHGKALGGAPLSVTPKPHHLGNVVGGVLFGVGWGGYVPVILLVMAAYTSLLACASVLLGSLARTESQTVGIGVFLATALAALGGCWWLIEIAPDWMQQLALFTPTGLTMDAMRRLVHFGDTTADVLPHVVILLLATLFFGYAAARSFRLRL